MKFTLHLGRARCKFYLISDNPKVSLGIVDSLFYTRRVALKDDHQKYKKDMFAHTFIEFDFFETLARTFIIPARQIPFNQEENVSNAPVRRNAIAINTNSAFTGSYTENPFWYRDFNLRHFRVLRWCQSNAKFDAADNCCFQLTTMNAMNFQDDIPSLQVDKLKDHYVLVLDLTSMQDVTESCRYPKTIWGAFQALAELFF